MQPWRVTPERLRAPGRQQQRAALPADEAADVFLLLWQSLELNAEFTEDPKNAVWSAAFITRKRCQENGCVDSHQRVAGLALSSLC